jgi:hypothetical protein
VFFRIWKGQQVFSGGIERRSRLPSAHCSNDAA